MKYLSLPLSHHHQHHHHHRRQLLNELNHCQIKAASNALTTPTRLLLFCMQIIKRKFYTFTQTYSSLHYVQKMIYYMTVDVIQQQVGWFLAKFIQIKH